MQTATNKSGVETPRSTPAIGTVPGPATASVLDTIEAPHANTATGLSSMEASRRLERSGPNAVADTALHPFRMALDKFWAPVPWMLEAAIVLQVVLGEYVEAAIIAGLLVFNAALGFFQEGRAQATLAALKSRLALTAAVRRNGVWTTLPAAGLAPGDIVKLSLGVVVAADMRLVEGAILLDQSMLTGESMPIEAAPGFQTYAGALVRRGEAIAEVTATGTAHEVWSYCGACSSCPCRQYPAEGCSACGAQSCPIQRHTHRHPDGVCRRSRHASC